ncbi:MAG TPA: GntR family transcriptional regulator [Thermodesulfobacteriota bacterium]|nr:GntR family transcriptional regulator [Thermodesulfobacteriota bacterium]
MPRKLPEDFAQFQRPRPLNDMAYETIKSSILEGKLISGEIYSELDLAKSFGISRTPVREAFLRLAAENLIIFHPRKGISVNYFSKEDIENLFELRQAIEEATANKIVGNLSKDQVRYIQETIRQQEACIKDKDYDENLFLEFDRKFHLFFVEISGNRFMVQTYNNIRDYITIPAREALRKKGRAKEVLSEHKAIVEALSGEDAERTKEAIKIHLINSKLAALECRQ